MGDAEASQVIRQLEGRAVNLVDEDHVIAGFEQAQKDRADRRHTGREAATSLAAFEHRQLALQDFYGGVATPGVDAVLMLRAETGDQLLERRLREESRLRDRRHRGTGLFSRVWTLDADLNVLSVDRHASEGISSALAALSGPPAAPCFPRGAAAGR